MAPETVVMITDRDRERLRALVQRLRQSGDVPTDDIDRLEERLNTARVIEAGDIPRSVVTMNSLIGLRDLGANEKISLKLSYPDEADVEKHKVAVTSPLGRLVLGARVGDEIECAVASGVRPLRVERVYYQPEAARDFHL